MTGHGVVIVLNDGSAGSVHSLFRKAVRLGFNGNEKVFADRIRKGVRDMDVLRLPVDRAVSDRARAAMMKRKEDPEFLAALAAVAARNGKR